MKKAIDEQHQQQRQRDGDRNHCALDPPGRQTRSSVTTKSTGRSAAPAGTSSTIWKSYAKPTMRGAARGPRPGQHAVVVAAAEPEPSARAIEGQAGHDHDLDARRGATRGADCSGSIRPNREPGHHPDPGPDQVKPQGRDGQADPRAARRWPLAPAAAASAPAGSISPRMATYPETTSSRDARQLRQREQPRRRPPPTAPGVLHRPGRSRRSAISRRSARFRSLRVSERA